MYFSNLNVDFHSNPLKQGTNKEGGQSHCFFLLFFFLLILNSVYTVLPLSVFRDVHQGGGWYIEEGKDYREHFGEHDILYTLIEQQIRLGTSSLAITIIGRFHCQY